jgi:hypothetical protein
VRWPLWLRLLRRRPEAAPDAKLAQREQEAKLRDFRQQRPEVRRAVNSFAAEVEAALARKQHR